MNPPGETAPQTRRIVIRPSGDAFAIAVEPPAHWTSHDTERPTYRAARRCAESLKVVTGWAIRDDVPADRRGAL